MSNLILYSPSETRFDTNGLGILTDVVDDYVIQQLNGQYELEFKYPSKSAHAADIVEDAYVTAKPDPETDAQPFRVYRISNAVRGLQTIRARHIAYNLKGICVPPFSASSAPAAMLALQTKAVTDNPFTFWTDKTTVAKMQNPLPSDIWSLLGGKEGSVLDTYRGEYEFEKYAIKLWNRRGADRGVSIRYGRNLRDLQQDRNIANMFTGVYPYWADSEGNLVQLSEHYISGPGTYREPKIRPLDLSQSFQTAPTEEQLRKEAERYIKTHDVGVPEVSIKVEFIQLEQTEEYKDTAILERVALGDTVSVIFPELQVDAKARVVSIKYQPTRDRYESVTIGKVKSNIAGTITEQQKEIARKPELTDMQAAIEAATSWLTNGQGYKVERRDPHTGQVIDTLYMDTPDINKAVNVLRMGQSGIGFSHSGVNGPYVSAWTIDGRFNADFITVGVLTATIIKTGILSDKLGRNYINLDTGETRIHADELTICGKTTESIAGEIANAAAREAKEAAALALNDYKSIINRTVEDLQGQIDGAIENWFGSELPTTTNAPAKDWSTPEEKAKHLGDLYYVDDNPDCGGQVYRWMQSGTEYRWKIVEDTEVAKALAEAAKAKDTADGKRRVFVTQPLPPYDVGDLWAQGTNGELLVCKASRVTGAQYLRSDWGPVADYVNSQTAQQIANQAAANPINKLTQAQIFNKLTNDGQIEGIYMKGGKLYLNATYIASGEIASKNRNVVINLDTGATTILDGLINLGDGKFMVDSTGYFQANVGKIGGLRIANSGLISDYVEFGPNGVVLKNGFESAVARIKSTIKTNRSPNTYTGLNMVATGQTDAIVISKEENPTTGQVIPILAYALASCGGAFTADAINLFVDWDMHGRVIRNASIDSRTSGARGGYTGTVGVGGYTLSFEGGFLMDVY